MSELKRLLDDDADELERALLLSARDETAPDGAHARALGALGVTAPMLAHGAGAGAAAAGGAAASGGTALQGGVLVIVVKWLGIGMVAGALTGGGLVAVTHTRAAFVAPAARPTAHAAVDRPRVLPHAVPAPASPPAPGTAALRRAAPGPGPSASAPPPPDVSQELALLDRARRDLASGDANGALDVLAEHDRRFHGGELGPEAEVLRVEALVAAGRGSEAARRARALLAARPHSPYTVRLRKLLARATAGGDAVSAPARRVRAAPPSRAPVPAAGPPSDRTAPSSVASFPANE